jgi:hypothetical protein
MRLALIVFGALVAVAVVVSMAGWMLPVKHRAMRQATYQAPASRIFGLLTDVDGYPRWRRGVERVEVFADSGGSRRFREYSSDGAITYQVETEARDRQLIVGIVDRSLPFGGRWTYDLLPAGGDSTTLRITEDGEVYNPLFRFVSRFVLGHHATIDRYLHDLAAALAVPSDVR